MLGLVVTLVRCGLRRTPKIYNALITTDDNITPSRAIPVIQPHFQETGIASYPGFAYRGYHGGGGYSSGYAGNAFGGVGGYSPFGGASIYDAYSQFGGYDPRLSGRIPIDGGFSQHELAVARKNDRGFGAAIAGVGTEARGISGEGASTDDALSVESETESSTGSSVSSDNEIVTKIVDNVMPTVKSPIPLNEFGLPPSLVPFNPYGFNGHVPVNLAPYPYNSYPLIYDQFGGGGGYQNPYLPAYGLYPQEFDVTGGVAGAGVSTVNHDLASASGLPARPNASGIGMKSSSKNGNDDPNGNSEEGGDSENVTSGSGLASGEQSVQSGSSGGLNNGNGGSGANGHPGGSSNNGGDGSKSNAGNSGSGGNRANGSNGASGADSGGSGNSGLSNDGSEGSGGSTSNGVSGGSSSRSNGNIRLNTQTKSARFTQPIDDTIKNYPKKIKNIPDVPPPPLPSGAKSNE